MSAPTENHQHLFPAIAPFPPIAVVGLSALFPGSAETGGFWRDILEGRDQIKDVPPEHWLLDDYYDPDPTAPDKTYGKRGAFLSNVSFDPMAYGMPPNTIQQTDTSQLLAMIVAQKVLDDAVGSSFTHVDKSRVSVILGATGTTELVVHLGSRLQRPIWLKALRENGIPEDEAQTICDQIANTYVPWTEASFPGLLGNVIAGRVANKFDLGGTNCVVDAACASSLSALDMGMNELYLGQSDMVITGGVDTLNDILMYMCFSKTPALSPSGDCRPFSDRSDGTILGEGVGLVALRRLEDAERDGDSIYAVIRGLGASSDGTGTAIYAPKSSGQARALRRAYETAGYSPRTVELLEAHGTATKAGDLAEFQGASSVFGEADPDDTQPTKTQWCAIGSVKSQIGHTKGAAGAASLIKAVLALHHKVLPATIKVDRPNPKLEIESSPFYINTAARPWVRDGSHPRRASVSSFGFGGSNFHIALEEYTGDGQPKDRYRPSPTELFLMSAESVEELLNVSNDLTAGFGIDDMHEDVGGFQFLARETQLNFMSVAPARLAVVAKNFTDLKTRIASAVAAISQAPGVAQQSPLGWYYSGVDSVEGAEEPGQVAFLFPGQGSQYVGMGTDLALAFANVQAVWDEAANLEFMSGQKLHDVVFPMPVFSDDERAEQETQLRATQWAQPAIGVTSLGQWMLLSKLGITPDCVGGHSFGEVTALHAAGVLDRDEFLMVARKRGELMAEAAETLPAAMTAVFHDANQITKLLTEWDIPVVIGNHNSPQQVVISGPTSAIEIAEDKLGQESIRFQRLSVSTAFHSEVVGPATVPFQAFLDQWPMAHPWLPVYANSTADLYPTTPEAIRETLASQIAQPVLFAQQIEAMYQTGVRTFVEVGPGTVLGNLVNSCLGDRPHRAISLDRKGQHGLTSLWHGIAQLVMAGIPMQLANLWEGINCGDDPRLRVAPKLAINISGVNYNKPYPPEGGSGALPAPNISAPATLAQDGPMRKEVEVPRLDHNGQNGRSDHLQPVVHGNGVRDESLELGKSTKAPGTPPVSSTQPVSPAQPVASTFQRSSPQVSSPPANGTGAPAATKDVGSPLATAPAQPAAPDSPAAPIAPSAQPMQAVPVYTEPVYTAPAPNQWAGASQISAFQAVQSQTADAHMAFLRVAEQSLRNLEVMLTGQPTLAAPLAAPPAAPAPTSYIGQAPAPVQPISPPVRAPEPSVAAHPTQTQQVTPPAPTVKPVAQVPLAPPKTPAPVTPSINAAPAQDLHAIMLDVVSEKTGYPTEMLEPTMSLSADLGIDSIKRVEILASMRERVPNLPEFDANEMVALNTLDEIVGYMDAALGGTASNAIPAVPAVPSTNGSAAPVAPSINAAPTQDLHAIMLDVVSEKTGYPTEMLEPTMSLSADLGIDSIKRVEILASMRERVPNLPEFDANEMVALNTLDEIVGYMDAALGGTASNAIPAVPAVPSTNGSAAPVAPSINAAPTQDLHAIMLDVVSEKTGYPTEMLEPTMSLSADLGIDSIKRVEILASMRERVPNLPEFDANEMVALNTLDEIVGYMDAALGGTASNAIPAVPAVPSTNGSAAPVVPSISAAPAQDLHAIMLDVVSEKTGYPTEMLEPTMSLSADLGIDSIKRVEILASMRERVPNLPEFDANEMAALNTLDEIVGYMDTALGTSALGGAASSAIPAVAATAAQPQNSATDDQLGRYVLEATPLSAPGFAPPFLIDGTPVQITDDGRGVALALADILNRAGANATVCAAPSADARAVICLTGLSAVNDPADAARLNAEGFRIATSIASAFEANGGLFVTVQDTGGDHGLATQIDTQSWLSGFSGLAKTAAQEWPTAVVRTIDIDQAQLSAQEIAARLATELLSGGTVLEIGLPADGRRVGFSSVARAVGGAHGTTPTVHSHSVVVVSGGGRGVTAATIIELAKDSQAKFALLGRSVLNNDEPDFLHASQGDAAVKKALMLQAQANGEKITPRELSSAANKVLAAREIRATLDALAAAGSEACYIPCDVTDVASTAAALQSVRDAWGPITGIVHGAGVLADKRLAEKSAEDFQRVFGTKVMGLNALLAATENDPLDLLCLFSSVAGRAGNAGQSDYAMANEVLNRVAQAEAQQRNQPGSACLVKSIGWGPWEGGMVTPLLKAKFEEMGVELIPLGAGTRSFVAEVQHTSAAEVDVVIGGGAPTDGPLLSEAQTAESSPTVYDITVSAESHPYLRSHQINGSVVLPLVTVQEWFLRAVGALSGQPFRGTCHKLRVLKGVPLPNFETEVTRFRIALQPDANQPSTLQAMLYDQDGVPRYAAQVILDHAQSFNGTAIPATSAEWPLVELSGSDLYGTKLFHGPDFAALHSITSMGVGGAEALLRGSAGLGWDEGQKNGWATDPGLIDGGLQLARVWGLEQLQQLTLPTALGDFILHQPGFFNPRNESGRQVRCLLQGQPIGSSGTRCNLWFVDDASGDLLAEIRGLEMYVSSETPMLAGIA